jgi:hypothetical protein
MKKSEEFCNWPHPLIRQNKHKFTFYLHSMQQNEQDNSVKRIFMYHLLYHKTFFDTGILTCYGSPNTCTMCIHFFGSVKVSDPDLFPDLNLSRRGPTSNVRARSGFLRFRLSSTLAIPTSVVRGQHYFEAVPASGMQNDAAPAPTTIIGLYCAKFTNLHIFMRLWLRHEK